MRKSIEKHESMTIDVAGAALAASTASVAKARSAVRPVPARDLVIRPMTLEDVPEVAELEADIFADAWSADSFLSEVDRRRDVGIPLVVRGQAGLLVAYAVVWFIVDETHIANIAVRPDYQGQGVGSLLLRHLLDEGRRRGFPFATLEVRPSNAPALRLYERFGFHRVAVRPNYYLNNGEDAYVLAAPIDPAPERLRG